MSINDPEAIKKSVREHYGKLARGAAARQAPCCPEARASAQPAAVERGIYAAEELAALPESASGFSLGCGNPTAVAGLRPGETVLDLGSGGGLDCLLAAGQVGAHGRVIGLDMTPEMIVLARKNAREAGAENVEFRFGAMEEMPVEGNSVDVILSNCVINLSPDKDAVFRESYRVLRPGGRFCVSDIVALRELPPEVRADLSLWGGCVGGVLPIEEYLAKLRAAGFEDVAVEAERTFEQFLPELAAAGLDDILTPADQPRAAQCCGAGAGSMRADWVSALASMRITAFKPAA